MREPKKFISLNGICMEGRAAIRISVLLVLTLCSLLPWQSWAENVKGMEQKPANADYNRLAGKWLRSDGGYVLELKDVKSDGRLKVSYFNPKPINVSKSEWRRLVDHLQVFIKFMDVNYPGSTYTLVYSPEHDSLGGYYYQAALGETFDVVFMRMK